MTNEKLYEMISFALNDNAIQTESIFNELIEDIVEDTLVDMQKEIFSEARTKEPGNETDAHELHLFATNDGDLYRRGATPIINNLKRKVKKGVYDHEKAVKLWKYHADNASKKYTKEVAGERHQTHLFSPATRELAARKMADYYKEDVHDSHHANESVDLELDEANNKREIYVDGKYHSTTIRSKTNKEAKENFIKAFPEHKDKKIQVQKVDESVDIEEGFAGIKHSGGPLHGKIDKRFSISKEYTGNLSGKPQYVARFAGDYLGSHETKEGAQEIAQKHSDLRDRVHSGIHENAIEMGLDLTEDQLEDIVEETLDELSKKTLVKYISKSAVNMHQQGMRRQLYKDKEVKDLEKHTTKKAGDRLKGIQRATLKLANENVDQEDSLDEVASNKFVNVATSRKAIRDTQKILNDNPDMMSGHKAEFKRTITIHKKHLEKAGHPFNENIEMGLELTEGGLNELSKKVLKNYVDKAFKVGVKRRFKDDESVDDNISNYAKQVHNRLDGIGRAINKIKKESIENDFLDEAVHPDEALRILKKHTDIDNNTNFFSLSSHQINNIEAERKKAKFSGRNSMGRSPTRQFYDHLHKQAAKSSHLMDESFDVEEETLDELSKKTLGNYVNAAAYDKSMASFKQGKAVGNAGAYHKRPDKETANKEAARDLKREKGIGSAIKKLTGQAKVNASESVDIEEAVHPADAHRILNSMGGKDADYFTLKSQHFDTLEDERKKAKYSGSNSLGRGKTRQFFYHLQKQAAKYKPYKANESFDMEEETLDESNDFLNEDFEKEQNKLIKMAGVKKKSKDTTTAIASNGDFVVHDRGTVIGRLKKGTWEHHAPSLREYVENSYDTEQEIEELSNKTLKSYLDKATREAARLSLTKNPSDEVKNKFRKRVRGMAKSSKLIKAEESLSNDDRESNESVDIEESKKTYIATIKHTRTGEIRKVKFRTSRSPRVEASTKLLNPLEYLHSIDSVKE